ncbi:acyl-CoA dehydrogenase family protein [Streptomyces varsoviensis]|uniref:acyl-CoA dehydrogenase family protein n=1 Tax=Streptomyces varsoviensis TaxID=67373 RepID=UPI00340DB2EC
MNTVTGRFPVAARDRLRAEAERWERAGAVPRTAVTTIARTGALGAMVPAEYGGAPWSHAAYGDANRLLGTVSAAAQSLLTVHGMVCRSLARWGAPAVRADWLPRLAAGVEIGAFALTEEQAGSDVSALTCTARPVPDGWRLTGVKRWISFGMLADVFLVFARTPRGQAAFAVRADDPGLAREPEARTAGFRAAHLARLTLDDCAVPADRLVGRPGFGLAEVAARALTLGRLCVAFGALGVAEACRDATLHTAAQRRRFGRRLGEFQLVQGLIADTEVALEGARALAQRAARALDDGDDWAVAQVLTAKLAASRAARLAADCSAQLHGAEGLAEGSPVERRSQDARVLEIIEGNTQLLQQLIAEQVTARWRAATMGRDA